MAWFSFLSRLFAGGGRGTDELARRLDLNEDELRRAEPAYRRFTIPKRSGGTRRILAPEPQLRSLQRRIVRRLLGRLRSHPCAVGFERGHSIVSHACHHAGRAVVVRMDLKDFFPSTPARRVERYFRRIGWNREAAQLLTRLCTQDGHLPQGAPTSPKLSNLLNWRLDARLTGLAGRFGAAYSRYADDLTFSFARDEPGQVRRLIAAVRAVVGEEGYTAHRRRKLHVRRQHNRQLVTGLVVNRQVNLPRETRRWLRAVEHHHRRGRPATLTPAQLAGWRSLQAMVVAQRAGPSASPPEPEG